MNSVFLIKNTKIVDANAPHHGQLVDIIIEKGIIKKMGTELSAEGAKVIDLDGASTSPGWLDVGTQVGDPGYEHKEDLQSVAQAAIAGGFTGIACFPNTNPTVHSKSEVLYIKNNALGGLVDFYPIGAVSHNCEGKEITEMYDMRKAGAIAFSDGNHAIQDSGLMMRSLLYVKPFNGVIINQPLNNALSKGGQVHEGEVSTALGLKGIPGIAEELMVQRDLYLSEYTDSRLHLANISSARSVELIREAKKKGFRVTASVNPVNLSFIDNDLSGFDGQLKVLPPVRSNEDREALRQGVKDGTIDLINSNHVPQDSESKNLEFLYAEYGAIGLETAYAAANTTLHSYLDEPTLIHKLACAPYELFNIAPPKIEEGQSANLTFFDSKKTWTFTQKEICSKSKNSPFLDKELTGKVLGIFNNGQLKMG